MEHFDELYAVQLVHNLIFPHFKEDDITLAKYIVHLYTTNSDLSSVLKDYIPNSVLIDQIQSTCDQALKYTLENNLKLKRTIEESPTISKKQKIDVESDDEIVDLQVIKNTNYFTKQDYQPIQQLIKLPNGSLSKSILTGSEYLKTNKQKQKHIEIPNIVASKKSIPTLEQQQLPIFLVKDKLLDTITRNQITIVIGETGSGKTTQLTQYIYHHFKSNLIACTQPRQLAAINVAKRVAFEMKCRLGGLVGYSVRFDDTTSKQTRIKYMTDGLLVRECLLDPKLSKYSVIFLDEAHERSLHTDVLFGLVKQACNIRKDLKVIVTSATLDAEQFGAYFNAPVEHIKGRTFPVDILYSKLPQQDYIESTINTICQIHSNEPIGDILCFLTGQEEIDFICDVMNQKQKKMISKCLCLPLYASLPNHLQERIFIDSDCRKIICSTNIAETSVTIPGIVYVVDAGYVKQNCYDPKLGMDSLVVVPISQAQANQRSGRAGRTKPGKCYRLYTEKAFNEELLTHTIPEIQRTNMANTVLVLLAMGIYDLTSFDFMDKPSIKSINTALEELFHLGAVDKEGLLTDLGKRMAELPLEPSLSKTLLTSLVYGCSAEILTIVAMLSVQQVFYRPKDKQSQADERKIKFHDSDGDHLTLLKVYKEWEKSKYSTDWCFLNFIQIRSLKRAKQIKEQLLGFLIKLNEPMKSTLNTDDILKCIVSGFFHHIAKKEKGNYISLIDETPMFMHPSSSLFQRQPPWVLYHELVLTSKEYMRQVIKIEPKWLLELAPHLYQPKEQKIEKLRPMGAKKDNPDDWRLSRQKKVYYNPQLFK